GSFVGRVTRAVEGSSLENRWAARVAFVGSSLLHDTVSRLKTAQRIEQRLHVCARFTIGADPRETRPDCDGPEYAVLSYGDVPEFVRLRLVFSEATWTAA